MPDLTGHDNERATLTVSPHRYELHTLHEAMHVECKRRGNKAMDRLLHVFDYIVGDMAYEPRLALYRGQWIDVWDMEYLSPDRLPQTGVLAQLARDGWVGWTSDTAWTGTIVRHLYDEDDGFVRVARVVWQ